MGALFNYRRKLRAWPSSQRVTFALLCTQVAHAVNCDADPAEWYDPFNQMTYSWLGLDDFDPDMFPVPDTEEERQLLLQSVVENLRARSDQLTRTDREQARIDDDCVVINMLLVALGFSQIPDTSVSSAQQNSGNSPVTSVAGSPPRSQSRPGSMIVTDPIEVTGSAGSSARASKEHALGLRQDVKSQTNTVFNVQHDELDEEYAIMPPKDQSFDQPLRSELGKDTAGNRVDSRPPSPAPEELDVALSHVDLDPGDNTPNEAVAYSRSDLTTTTAAGEPTFRADLYVFHYDARSRAVLFGLAHHLGIPMQTVYDAEKWVAQTIYVTLTESIDDHTAPSDQTIQGNDLQGKTQEALSNDRNRRKIWKYLATGAATALGATAIGLTAGLAAPLVVAGLGALSITGLAFFSTAGGVALISSLFGLAGGGLTGYRMNRRVRSLHEFKFEDLVANDERLPVPSLVAAILIPGFLNEPTEANAVWQPYFVQGRQPQPSRASRYDPYVLRFETEALLAVGNAFNHLLGTEAVHFAAGQVLKQTVLATLISAMAWPMAIIKVGQLIDNPWSVGLNRARSAGELLADVLISRAQGNRPVVLVGYSLGALVIYHCLLRLAARHDGEVVGGEGGGAEGQNSSGSGNGGPTGGEVPSESRPKQHHGLVDSVVLLGGPFDGQNLATWSQLRRVVARRIVVGYSTNDWLLAYLYRVQALSIHMAGLTGVSDEVRDCLGIENLDLTDLVASHSDYTQQATAILERVDI
ncbi:hypothetical protein IWQ60_004558 [Tieghemiomyces parasiticus]|uniref:DUF726-domain-containing protein n=1 Tax=Tieghemiomyces parasiticus TaxID=78921 RepID=A0A9W8A7Z7_9FUNG|nr:hypothetical protein IWQ60_004558 [Tieghemiomyces parasiticus]